ncbi:MAG: 3-dehydroquinate synthase [Hyphomicrobiaceae bacterium]
MTKPTPSSLDAASPSDTARRIRVELGERGYDVLVGPGLAADAGRLIVQVTRARRCAIITDSNVERAGHAAALESSLAAETKVLGRVVMAPGEATKCFAELEAACRKLLALGVERNDLVIALGGGVIGDLAGFAAAILRRGVRFVQVPTTLLAQVDSSVGGKTGINTAEGKNLIGAFHQPSLVLADTNALSTLPDRQMRAGYAEIVKHAALGDAAYFRWLETNGADALARRPEALTHAVARSVEMKAEIVARDETEQGDRMLLNLGHTFGHALEAWAGFSDRLYHGEAVALGTAMAFRFSESLGLCPEGTAARVAAHLTGVDLPTRISDISGQDKPTASELLDLMAQDKKVRDGRMTFILAHGIGQAFASREVERDKVVAFLAAETGA